MKSLKPLEDAYGRLIWAHYNGEEAVEIIERDDGYISVSSGPRVYFSDYEAWHPIVKEAMEFVKGRVLDIGCGAGRHSLYLQEKGFDVTGIDLSPLAVRICKLRGLNKAYQMSIDDVDFDANSFDTVIMMGGNFGLFGSYKKAQKLLKRFYKMTSKNALILGETRDPYETDKSVHLEYHEFNRRRNRMGGQARIRVRFERCCSKWFDYLMVSKSELNDILRDTKWKVKDYIDSGGDHYIGLLEKKG